MSSPESESEENGVLRESGDIPLYDDTVFEEEELEEDTKKRVVRGMIDKTHTKTLDYNTIVEEQRSSIERANEILNIKPALIRILLRHCGWDVEKLVLRVLEEGDAAIFKEASVMREPIVKVHSPQVTCTVCDEVVPRDQASSASCGHMFCNNCWKQYLTVQINELQLGGGLIRCMQNKCTILVDEDLVHKIVDAELFKRYMNFLLESYVTKRPYHTWCPTPGCGSAIAITRGETMVGVQCGKCERSFCFSCQREPHLPATCAMVSAWHQKAKDDSETANWLVSHTKECPQCHKAVEKNGGCNHISCTCGAHFCWMCLGLFDTRTVYSHACNAFDDSNAFANANAQTARATLERYLHYYNRFYNHEQSKKLEANILVNIREKMNKLFERDKANASWISVQYLEQSAQILFASRENLKWTYVYAYFMFDQIQNPNYLQGMKPFKNDEEMRRAKDQFEFHQNGLEFTTERLSGMLEMSIEQIAREKDYRVKVLDLTKVLQTKFDAMFDVVEWIKTKGATGTMEGLKLRQKQREKESTERQRQADEELKQWQLRQRTLKK